MQTKFIYNSTNNRKIKIVLDKNENYDGGTPVMIYLYWNGEEFSATWNCFIHEGTIEDRAVTDLEHYWINSKADKINAFIESLVVA